MMIAAKYDVVDVYETERSMPVSTKQLAHATAKDVQLQDITSALREKKEIPAKLCFNVNQAAFSTIAGSTFVQWKGDSGIVAKSILIRDLHKSHFGVAKMKALTRGLYRWLGVDKAMA